MIEGLSARPWLEAARRTEPDLLNCETCQQHNDEATRKLMGCGFVLPPLSAHADEEPSKYPTWAHRADEGAAYRRCAGYTTNLPDVHDVGSCYRMFETGQLEVAARDPVRPLLDGLRIFDGAVLRMRSWEMKNPKESA